MRSLVFTVTSVSLGVTAHLLGGGAPPALRLLLPLTLVVWLCSEAFAATERRGHALFAGVLTVQALVHLALLGHGGMSMASMSSSMSGAAAPMPLLETPRMLAAHLAAGLVAAVLMRHAEAGLWRMRRWVAARLRPWHPGRPVPPVAEAAMSFRTEAPHRPWGLVVAAARSRRGPPRCA